MSEVELILYIKENIRELLPSLTIASISTNVKIDNKYVDLLIQTRKNEDCMIEVKSSSEPAQIHQAISQLKSFQTSKNECLIVATPKMSEKGKNLCKQAGVGYLDLQGNVYIEYKRILIDRTGERKLPHKFERKKRRVKQPFTESSFHVLIYLLINRERYVTQQELASNLDVSKGYINRILKTFEDGIVFYGETLLFKDVDRPDTTLINTPNIYIVGEVTLRGNNSELLLPTSSKRPMKFYRLTNSSKIIEILSKEYDFNSNRYLGFYSFEKEPSSLIKKIAQESKRMNLPYALTQHAGASLVAPYVRFNDVNLYVKEKDIQTWISALNLKDTELGGNVNLIIPKYNWFFNETQTIEGIKILKDELLYLDLINYPKRGKEQAEFLREQRLRF